jgi:hypothetical protein
MASELLIPSPTHETFPRGSALLMDGYRPRYNKSLDSLDTVDTPPANATTGFYQAGGGVSRKSEDNILGLTSPGLVTQFLNGDDAESGQSGGAPDKNEKNKFECSPTAQGPSRLLCDRVDPEDSIRDMVSENDFYRYILYYNDDN